MSELVPVVIREDDYTWRVRCQGPDCDRVIDVPKRVSSADGERMFTLYAPSPRGCIDHPPSTWIHREDSE